MREETVEEWVEIDDIEDAAEEAHVIEVDEALLDGEVADDDVAQSGIEVAEEVLRA